MTPECSAGLDMQAPLAFASRAGARLATDEARGLDCGPSEVRVRYNRPSSDPAPWLGPLLVYERGEGRPQVRLQRQHPEGETSVSAQTEQPIELSGFGRLQRDF